MSNSEGGYESKPYNIEEENQNIHIDNVSISHILASRTSKKG